MMEAIGNYLYAAGVKNAIITLPYEKHTQDISILHDSIKCININTFNAIWDCNAC